MTKPEVYPLFPFILCGIVSMSRSMSTDTTRSRSINVASITNGGYCSDQSSHFNEYYDCCYAINDVVLTGPYHEWLTNDLGVESWMTLNFAQVYTVNRVRFMQQWELAELRVTLQLKFPDQSSFVVSTFK